MMDVFNTIVSSMNLPLNICQSSVLQASCVAPETDPFLVSWNGSLTSHGVGRGAREVLACVSTIASLFMGHSQRSESWLNMDCAGSLPLHTMPGITMDSSPLNWSLL